MKLNEASWDRIARVGAGVGLLALSATVFSGVLVAVGVIAGLILTVTGAVGWCPIYAALRIGSRRDSSSATLSA
jgi:hypothetical protein